MSVRNFKTLPKDRLSGTDNYLSLLINNSACLIQFDAQKVMQDMQLAQDRLNVTQEIARMKDDLGRDRLDASNRIKQAELLIKRDK